MWQRQTRPIAIGILWAWGFLMAVLLTLQCSCQVGVAYYPRTLTQQHMQTVRISALCVDPKAGMMIWWWGTGVVVNDRQLFTAAHVATAQPGMLCSWMGELIDGTKVNLAPGYLDQVNDLASMHTINGAFPGDTSVTFGPVPQLGDRVCEVAAAPYHVHRCGEVQMGHNPPGDLVADMIVEPGNSGSGVFDSMGRLIGIAVHMTHCGNGQICGAEVSTLEGKTLDLLTKDGAL